MEIKVYISIPRGGTVGPLKDHYTRRMINLRDRLDNMLNHKVARIEVVNNGPDLFEVFDGFIKDGSLIKKADFVIFADGWKDDKRCKVEDKLVTEYNIPHCYEDDMLRYLANFIHHQVLALTYDEEALED